MISILITVRITVIIHLIEIDIIIIQTIQMDPILRIIEIDLVLREDIEVLLIIEIIKVETISFIIITIDKDMIMVIRDKRTDNYQITTGIIVGHQGIIDLHLGIGQCRIDTNVQDLNLQIIVMNVIE